MPDQSRLSMLAVVVSSRWLAVGGCMQTFGLSECQKAR